MKLCIFSCQPKKWAAAAAIMLFCLLGAYSWSFAQSASEEETIADLSAWAAQRAPADTEILLTLDESRSPRRSFSSAEIQNIVDRAGALLSLAGLDGSFFDNIDVGELQWLDDKAVLIAYWPRGEGQFKGGALILHTNDEAQAKDFLENNLEGMPGAVRNGMVYIASSAELLSQISGPSSQCLADSPKFRAARQRCQFGRHTFFYADLTYMAPQAAELLASACSRGRNSLAAAVDLSDVRALASSLRCMVGGEEYAGKLLKGEMYLLADTAESGKLGKILFDPSYNIAHPAVGQRSADSQMCWAANVKYNYDCLYALMGMHPLTSELRGYPNSLLADAGITVEKDILGELLTGSVVCSVENLDYVGLMRKIQEQSQLDAAEKRDSGEKTAAKDKKRKSAAARKADLYLEALYNSDWRVSADLRSRQKLSSLAERINFLQLLCDGSLAKDKTAAQRPVNAAAERWGSLPPAKVVGNTVWIAGKPQNCGPVSDSSLKLEQSGCWQALEAMSGGRAAAMWMSGNKPCADGAAVQADNKDKKGLSSFLESLRKRGGTQCGSLVIVPGGLRFCEVIEEER